MPRALVAVVVVVAALAAGCSQGSSPSVSVTNAGVDPVYTCPPKANDAAYDVHGTLTVHNGTSSPVTVKTVTAVMTLEAVGGAWLEKAGDVYDAGAATFTPATVAPRSSATLKVTIRSACTSAASGTVASHGDYRVTLRVSTSAGNFTLSAANLHRIVAA